MIECSLVLVLACLPHIICCFPVSTSIRLHFHALSGFNIEETDLRFMQEKNIKTIYFDMWENGIAIKHTSQEFSYKTVKSLKQFNPCLVFVLSYISSYFLPFAKNSINLIFDENMVIWTCSCHVMSNNLAILWTALAEVKIFFFEKV